MKSIPDAPPNALDVAARRDRRKNILDSAQRLFARYGYHGVTIRQIAADARVPLALVGYYFGQKQELYDAIFGFVSETINQRRQDLRAALALHTGDRLQHIVSALVRPVVRARLATPEGESYALFVARALSQQGVEEDRAIRQYFDPVAAEFIDALATSLAVSHPGFTHAHAAWGFQFALGALLHYLTDQRVTRLSGGINAVGDPMVAAQLVAFIAHGLRGMAQAFADAETATPALPVTL